MNKERKEEITEREEEKGRGHLKRPNLQGLASRERGRFATLESVEQDPGRGDSVCQALGLRDRLTQR